MQQLPIIRKLRPFCAILAFIGLAPLSFARPTKVIEVKASSRQERSRLANLGYALEDIRSDRVYLNGNQKDVEKIKAAGFDFEAHEYLERFEEIDAEFEARFTSYPEVLERLNALVEKAPHLAQLQSIGESWEGRDIVAIRIGNHTPDEAQLSEIPTMIYMGCHHAREHLSVEVPLLFAEHLVENFETDERLQLLLSSREIYIVPVVNPDGHLHDYTDGIRGSMWRKNRRQNRDGSVGVDLNRNYGYGWGTGGSSTDPSSDVFMGAEPFSEPETQAVRNFVSSQPRLKMMMDYHSFSELILYPWGNVYDPIENEEDRAVFEIIANTMAGWNGYTPQQGSDLYIASGNLFDWAYGDLGLFAFTFELSPASFWDGGFYPNPEIIPSAFEDNLEPMLYLLEYADDPYRVTSELDQAATRAPVASFGDLRL